MKNRLAKLLTVKSIVTIVLTLVFSYLAIVGIIAAEQVMTVFTVVISFYFGSQSERLNNTIEQQMDSKSNTN